MIQRNVKVTQEQIRFQKELFYFFFYIEREAGERETKTFTKINISVTCSLLRVCIQNGTEE